MIFRPDLEPGRRVVHRVRGRGRLFTVAGHAASVLFDATRRRVNVDVRDLVLEPPPLPPRVVMTQEQAA